MYVEASLFILMKQFILLIDLLYLLYQMLSIDYTLAHCSCHGRLTLTIHVQPQNSFPLFPCRKILRLCPSDIIIKVVSSLFVFSYSFFSTMTGTAYAPKTRPPNEFTALLSNPSRNIKSSDEANYEQVNIDGKSETFWMKIMVSEAKMVVDYAWPLLITYLVGLGMKLVDVWFLGRLGSQGTYIRWTAREKKKVRNCTRLA